MESLWSSHQEFEVSENLHLSPPNKTKWLGLLVVSNILILYVHCSCMGASLSFKGNDIIHHIHKNLENNSADYGTIFDVVLTCVFFDYADE